MAACCKASLTPFFKSARTWSSLRHGLHILNPAQGVSSCAWRRGQGNGFDLPIEQDSSVSDIAKNIADLQPPSSIKFLHDCIAILKQREFVEKLEVPGETMDHVKVADQVKDMVTIASFNADILKKLMPKHFETVSKFTQMASVNAMAIVDKVTKEYEHIPDIIKKQKPPDRTM